MTIRLTIVGATGRMGRELLAALAQFPDFVLVGAAGAPDDLALGREVTQIAPAATSRVVFTSDVPLAIAAADVVVDFSSAHATHANLAACVQARKALFIGTTGLAPDIESEFAAASSKIALLVAPNTSLGVTLLLALAEQAARTLPAEFDVEIAETHHRHKVDAPSGTALALGRAVALGRGTRLADRPHVTGAGRREPGTIGFSVSRGGDVVGDHQLRFLGTGEQLVLGHIATDRSIFARGALTGARWLASRGPGRYRMADVLGFDSSR